MGRGGERRGVGWGRSRERTGVGGWPVDGTQGVWEKVRTGRVFFFSFLSEHLEQQSMYRKKVGVINFGSV